METKEDILAIAALERELAPEIMGERAAEYLEGIEHTVREHSEAGEEYYLVYRGGAVGFFALYNEGPSVTLTKLAVSVPHRRSGIARRIVAFVRETYDPEFLRIASYDRPCPALEAMGFALRGAYYEKRYE